MVSLGLPNITNKHVFRYFMGRKPTQDWKENIVEFRTNSNCEATELEDILCPSETHIIIMHTCCIKFFTFCSLQSQKITYNLDRNSPSKFRITAFTFSLVFSLSYSTFSLAICVTQTMRMVSSELLSRLVAA